MLKLICLLLAVGLLASLAVAEAKSKLSGRRDRIFRGTYDSANEYRFHVAILKVYPNETTEHICGGAIIDSRYVLTGAHCVYEVQKNELVIRSGWNKDPEHPHLEKRSFHKVSRIMYLKDYSHSACRHHEHDIAILKVKKNFDLADDANFKKINLPEYDQDYEGLPVTITGFGVEKMAVYRNKSSGESLKKLLYPNELKVLSTNVIPLEQCKKLAPVVVTNSNVCTTARNKAGFTCVGDDGSPLVFEGVVVGIRNSHNSECMVQLPEVFTRVSSYLDFINKVLNQESSSEIVYV